MAKAFRNERWNPEDVKQTLEEARRSYAEFQAELHESLGELLSTVFECEAKAREERWS